MTTVKATILCERRHFQSILVHCAICEKDAAYDNMVGFGYISWELPDDQENQSIWSLMEERLDVKKITTFHGRVINISLLTAE